MLSISDIRQGTICKIGNEPYEVIWTQHVQMGRGSAILRLILKHLVNLWEVVMSFNGKTLLITGGTGSFGNAVLRRFLGSDIAEIRIFSRDEKKQDDMRKKYNNPKLKFYIGNVRDYNSVNDAMRGVDFVFQAAALKQVPSCEFYPMQAVKTNILGTDPNPSAIPLFYVDDLSVCAIATNNYNYSNDRANYHFLTANSGLKTNYQKGKSS